MPMIKKIKLEIENLTKQLEYIPNKTNRNSGGRKYNN